MDKHQVYRTSGDDIWLMCLESGPGKTISSCMGNEMFSCHRCPRGQTAAGPDPRTDDTLSDAALYLLTFKGYSIGETVDSFVELYGDGDKKENESNHERFLEFDALLSDAPCPRRPE
ncbi:hypothetical protein PAAG_05842 [Paracoccidioides lutzii Pb01]|uniref:Uncharacterized protein n=1 Tax=Paracoccidioides lutzii (strain ATCC MYA-826 / Pb01) TaxID=502779 RepID=C1H501_PARBA|nr:hypothetical protein PAAG_05842 [Paracoccidioides lutzii Pb01]EEH34795.2 hypothetical protein PAAG_05842 [Paracoccidioides lutzii Pb01]